MDIQSKRKVKWLSALFTLFLVLLVLVAVQIGWGLWEKRALPLEASLEDKRAVQAESYHLFF